MDLQETESRSAREDHISSLLFFQKAGSVIFQRPCKPSMSKAMSVCCQRTKPRYKQIVSQLPDYQLDHPVRGLQVSDTVGCVGRFFLSSSLPFSSKGEVVSPSAEQSQRIHENTPFFQNRTLTLLRPAIRNRVWQFVAWRRTKRNIGCSQEQSFTPLGGRFVWKTPAGIIGRHLSLEGSRLKKQKCPLQEAASLLCTYLGKSQPRCRPGRVFTFCLSVFAALRHRDWAVQSSR